MLHSPEVTEQRVAQVVAHATTDAARAWAAMIASTTDLPTESIIERVQRRCGQHATQSNEGSTMHANASRVAEPTMASTSEIYERRRDTVANARARRNIAEAPATSLAPVANAEDIYARRAHAVAVARERSRHG